MNEMQTYWHVGTSREASRYSICKSGSVIRILKLKETHSWAMPVFFLLTVGIPLTIASVFIVLPFPPIVKVIVIAIAILNLLVLNSKMGIEINLRIRCVTREFIAFGVLPFAFQGRFEADSSVGYVSLVGPEGYSVTIRFVSGNRGRTVLYLTGTGAIPSSEIERLTSSLAEACELDFRGQIPFRKFYWW